jgi:hypothetical protein
VDLSIDYQDNIASVIPKASMKNKLDWYFSCICIIRAQTLSCLFNCDDCDNADIIHEHDFRRFEDYVSVSTSCDSFP